jgi:polar amino acid transport system substrate-binding protein
LLRSFRSFNEKSLQVAGGNKAGNGLVDLFCVKFFSINLLIKGRVSGIFLFQAVVGKTFLQRESAFFLAQTISCKKHCNTRKVNSNYGGNVMKLQKKLIGLLLIGVMTIFAFEVANAADKVLINGFDADYPPFSYISKAGNPTGFDIDAINWIAARMHFKVKHQPTAWSAIVPSLETKKIDLIASGMSISPERQKVVDFSQPYWIVRQILIVRKDSKLTGEQCLAPGRKIGTQRGNAETQWIQKNLLQKGKKFELLQYDSAPMAVEDLVMGRIDAVATSDTVLKEALEKGSPVKSIGGYGQPDTNYGYAVRKDETGLLNKLNKGLEMLKASPYWEQLKKKYNMR